MLKPEVNADELLDRICQVYGFTQKVQLAKHFDIAASSLQNRYARGTISYDFAVYCALETGTNLKWLITGQGSQHKGISSPEEPKPFELYTLRNGKLTKDTVVGIDKHFLGNQLSKGICVRVEGKIYFIDQEAVLSDGLWLVDIEDAINIRELTKLPGKRLHVAGGNVPFECGVDGIKTLGRVVGIYSEINQ